MSVMMLFFIGFLQSAWAQTPSPTPMSEHEINIDLMSFCEQEKSKVALDLGTKSEASKRCSEVAPINSAPLTDLIKADSKAQKAKICESLEGAAKRGAGPVEIHLKDDQNQAWKIRFYFGYNRTQYLNTDLHLQTDRVNVVIKDFSFAERTSAEYYNPKNWDKFENSFRWVDEPTNSFTFALEHKKDVLEINVFHPKFLKQNYETKQVIGTVDGVALNQQQAINLAPNQAGYSDPGAMHLTRFESTHKQLDLQIGYGHKFTLYQGAKASVSYIPHIDAGVTLGENRLIYEKKNTPWSYEQVNDQKLTQGLNVSVGNRLEYRYGVVGAFVDQRFTHSHLVNTYSNGKAEYDMNYFPVAMGVSLDLISLHGKPKVKK